MKIHAFDEGVVIKYILRGRVVFKIEKYKTF